MHEERLALLCALVAIVLQSSRFRDHGILLALSGILLLLWQDHREARLVRILPRESLVPSETIAAAPSPILPAPIEPAPVAVAPEEPLLEAYSPKRVKFAQGRPVTEEIDESGVEWMESSAPVPRGGRYAEQLKARVAKEGTPVWHKRDRLARVTPRVTQSVFRDATGQTTRFSHLR